MEKLVSVGLLDPGVKDNVYEELLEKIDKNKLSANILTVTIVNALSKLVYIVVKETVCSCDWVHLQERYTSGGGTRIPDICHFFYTGSIFKFQILPPMVPVTIIRYDKMF